MKVLFVVPYPVGKAASQRYRVEQLLPLLHAQSIEYKIAPFWNEKTWAILYKPGHTGQKVWGLTLGFLKRLWLLLQLFSYQFVFIHREATPVGPPWFEWLAGKVFRKKLIYDFDDAIWLAQTTTDNAPAAKYKWTQKVAHICRWSYKVSCGNYFLQEYARKYNQQAVYLPTLLDTENRYSKLKQQQTEELVIGWIGSHSTLPYLKMIEPVLQKLEKTYKFDFLVIADKQPDLKLESLKYKVWQEATEVEDLLEMNIGVMPLPDTDWAKGKCAFKALQYMALGVPAVVSAVGANVVAVRDGSTGYSCGSEKEWQTALEKLLNNTALRTEMGRAARTSVQQRFAVQAHQQTFLNLFT